MLARTPCTPPSLTRRAAPRRATPRHATRAPPCCPSRRTDGGPSPRRARRRRVAPLCNAGKTEPATLPLRSSELQSPVRGPAGARARATPRPRRPAAGAGDGAASLVPARARARIDRREDAELATAARTRTSVSRALSVRAQRKASLGLGPLRAGRTSNAAASARRRRRRPRRDPCSSARARRSTGGRTPRGGSQRLGALGRGEGTGAFGDGQVELTENCRSVSRQAVWSRAVPARTPSRRVARRPSPPVAAEGTPGMMTRPARRSRPRGPLQAVARN